MSPERGDTFAYDMDFRSFGYSFGTIVDTDRPLPPTPAALVDAGAKGVLVYSFAGRPPPEYLDECRRLGLRVVWIWERGKPDILRGFQYAVDQCREHEASAKPGELTYVACDLNNGDLKLDGRDLMPFLRGWAATTREPIFGLYGPQDAILQAQRANIPKLARWWGVVNWITDGRPDNAPENIAFWRSVDAHVIQLIGSPIALTDRDLILRADWATIEEEDDDVKAMLAKLPDDDTVWICFRSSGTRRKLDNKGGERTALVSDGVLDAAVPARPVTPDGVAIRAADWFAAFSVT
jgi:Rv2525c-like, glycoside hydrolase-like domain